MDRIAKTFITILLALLALRIVLDGWGPELFDGTVLVRSALLAGVFTYISQRSRRPHSCGSRSCHRPSPSQS